jgi:multidrug efflux pump subunit AcrB
LGKHAAFLWVAPALLAVVGAMGVANWIWSTQMPESLDIFSLFGWMLVIGLMIGKAGLIYVNAAVAIGKGAGKMGAIAKALEVSMKHWGVVFIATMAWLAVLLHPYFQADFESVVRSIYSVLALGIFVWLVWPAILSLFPLQRFSPKKSKK